jgi:hypothetical protein
MRTGWLALAVLIWGGAPAAFAQTPEPPPPPAAAEHVDVAETLLTPAIEAPGNAWQPRETPMFGIHRGWRGWDVRVDGSIALQWIAEPGDRHRTGGEGAFQPGSRNWGMLAARRRLGRGRIGLHGMLSAEPATLRGCGALSYLSVGEICDGDTIHDRDQPHDLVMELAVEYEHPLHGAWRWQMYAGLAGAPAFGPPASPHRPSAAGSPLAPFAHHWLDPVDAFGVVTAAIHDRRWKVEVSAFNSRAPDERRTDLDLGSLDAVSARVSYLPADRVAVQVSAARMQDARGAFEQPPDPAATKVSASVVYHRRLGRMGLWASTVAVGLSKGREQIPGGVFEAANGAALAETSVTVGGRHQAFGRVEFAEMPAHHLHAHEYAASVFPVGKLQVGYTRLLRPRHGLVPGFGATASVTLLPPELAPRYGGRAAPGFATFVSLRPTSHAM